MDKQLHGTLIGIPDESTVMAGPDYVALVIEWDEPAVEEVAETQVTQKTIATRMAELPMRTIAKAAGAVAAVVFTAWGVHRLRAA